MRVLTAILLLIALATGCCRTADGQDLPDNNVVPLVDHHQHLLSPAGAALQNAYRQGVADNRLFHVIRQSVTTVETRSECGVSG